MSRFTPWIRQVSTFHQFTKRCVVSLKGCIMVFSSCVVFILLRLYLQCDAFVEKHGRLSAVFADAYILCDDSPTNSHNSITASIELKLDSLTARAIVSATADSIYDFDEFNLPLCSASHAILLQTAIHAPASPGEISFRMRCDRHFLYCVLLAVRVLHANIDTADNGVDTAFEGGTFVCRVCVILLLLFILLKIYNALHALSHLSDPTSPDPFHGVHAIPAASLFCPNRTCKTG